MCSSDFGLCDFFLDREDFCIKEDEDNLRNVLFNSSTENSYQNVNVKQESDSLDFQMFNQAEADDLWKTFLRNDNSLKREEGDIVDDFFEMGRQEKSLSDDLKGNGDLEDLVGIPFNAVIDNLDTEDFEATASDSGLSSDHGGGEQNLSPRVASPDSQRRSIFSSPENGISSPDTMDADSEVSSNSDLGSLGGSPIRPGNIPSFTVADSENNYKESPLRSTVPIRNSNSVKLEIPAKTKKIPNTFTVKNPHLAKIRLGLGNGLASESSTTTLHTLTSNSSSSTHQTIVVSPSSQTSSALLKNSTLLKTASLNGKSILLPVNVKDINQVKTIKIISASHSNGSVNKTNGVRTLVSAMRPGTQTSASNTVRTSLFTSKKPEERSLLRVAPTAFVSPNNATATHVVSSSNISKEEIYSDDENHQNGQELHLTDEEKRLLKKESIVLPSHYPLTKQEERDLKRIRRKIRNKISAQDSRKRKKEYVDGLEDRVRHCTEENHQLQKRIRHLESQNETLVSQLKKFHSLIGNTMNSRPQTHASTALMMLILSAALFVAPSLRSQENGGEKEVSGSSKMPSAGRSRSLLETGVNLGMNSIDNLEDEEKSDADGTILTNPLSDHDYAPLAKKQKLMTSYYPSFIDEFLPQTGKTTLDSPGEPPDSVGGLKGISALMGAFFDSISTNWTETKEKEVLNSGLGSVKSTKGNHSLVVNINPSGRLRDDIELE